jgi:hypothetical protein
MSFSFLVFRQELPKKHFFRPHPTLPVGVRGEKLEKVGAKLLGFGYVPRGVQGGVTQGTCGAIP